MKGRPLEYRKHFANREQNMIKQKVETNKQLHHLHAWLTPTPLCQVTNNLSETKFLYY